MNRISLLVGLFAIGCSSPAAPPQTVSGRVEQAGFPAHVDGIRVVQGTSEIVSAALASDDTFALTIPAGTTYRIEFLSLGEPSLVFPRASGSIDTTFTILSGTQPFDLGKVRFIGDAASNTFHMGTPGEEDDVECEDGIDENGAVCVDDDDDEGAGCEDGTDDGETNDDGTDPGDGDGEEDDDGPQGQAAVAEHNLPSSIGCDDHADGEEEDD